MSYQMLGQAIAQGQRRASQTGLRLRWAVVQAVHASPASVDLTIDGSASTTSTVKYLSTYSPVVNDTVAVLEQPTHRGPDYLVLGKTA